MLTIRTASPDDAESLLEIYAPYVTDSAITFEYTVPTVSDFRERIYHILSRYPYLVAEEDSRPVGYAYASAFHSRAAYDWCCETSIYISEDHHGEGIGRKLYNALESSLSVMGIRNCYACIASPEIEDAYLTRNSIFFHAHLGYRLIGEFRQCGYKFGRWYNMVWMEKMIGDHPESPEPVLSFHTF